jgi:FAD/FMN-containing dehydrogenase
MDMFGIGSAITAVVDSYFQGARRTGRTTRLLASVKAGDRIVTVDENQARLLRGLLGKDRRDVTVLVLPVKDPLRFGTARSKGKTVFDHTWIEELYRLESGQVDNSLKYLEDRLSGSGMPDFEYREGK